MPSSFPPSGDPSLLPSLERLSLQPDPMEVRKDVLCYDRAAINFASTPYFASNHINSKERLAQMFWEHLVKEGKYARLTRNPEIAQQHFAELKEFCLNLAEHVLTLLTLKSAPWAKNVVDGVLQLDLDTLLTEMNKPEWNATETARRWYITGFFYPYAFTDAAEFERKKRYTWAAMGKYVTAVDKVTVLVDLWKNGR